MTDHPAQNRREIAALKHDHGARWQIEHEPELDAWIAVRKSPDGRHIRVLVAHDPPACVASWKPWNTTNPARTTPRVSPSRAAGGSPGR